MKKFLLSLAVAMVTISASAQAPITSAKHATPAAVKLIKAESVQALAPAKKAEVVKKAPAASELAGTYILNYDNWDGTFTASSEFTISEGTGTITLPADEGKVAETFEYNVILNDFAALSGSTIYGNYNAKEGYIEIPAQVAGTNATYGDYLFSACVTVNGVPSYFGYDMILMVDDEGNLEIYDAAEELSQVEGMTEGAAITGFYNYLVSGDGAWTYGFECAVYKPNATMSYITTGARLGGDGTNSWADVTKRVYVEDYETELVVNNFLGLCPISITVNEDKTCYIDLPAVVDDHDYSEEGGFAYGLMRIFGCYIDGNSIGVDRTATALNGFVYDEGIEFFKTEHKEAWTDGEGKQHEEGDYFIDDDPNYIRYFIVATDADAEGAAYGWGWCGNAYIAFDKAGGEGISDVTATAQKGAQKTFNIMGQQVSKSTKGLLIRDGKKFINK